MLKKGKAPHFREDDQGTLWDKNRICVPDVKDLWKLILSEAHDTAYSIHPSSTKMYYDLKERFWWYGMMRSMEEYVAICDTCQRVKAEHQRPVGLCNTQFIKGHKPSNHIRARIKSHVYTTE